MIRATFIITFFLICTLGFGQQQVKVKDSASIGSLFKHDAKATIKSVGHAFTRPIYWKGDDYLKMAGMFGGTILLSTADDEINRFFLRQQDDFPELIRDIGWYFGSPQNFFMANAGLYGYGLFTKNEQVRRTSVLIISSSITTGFITSMLKSVVGRARPDSGLGNWYFKSFSPEGKFHSFPSGHSSLSITMAHAIAKQFENTWVKIGIYSIGAIPPISRLVDNAHWITDIAFSTALSIIVVDSIDKYLFESKTYNYPKKKKLVSWNLKFTGNQIGVIGTF